MKEKISKIFSTFLALLMVLPFLTPLGTVFADVGSGNAGSNGGIVGDYAGYVEWYDEFDKDRNPKQGWNEDSKAFWKKKLEAKYGPMSTQSFQGETPYIKLWNEAADEALRDARKRSDLGRARIIGVLSYTWKDTFKQYLQPFLNRNLFKNFGRPGNSTELPDNVGWSTLYNNKDGATGKNWRQFIYEYGMKKAGGDNTMLTLVVWAVADNEPIINTKLSLKKENSDKKYDALLKGNKNYTLSGAEYGLYKTKENALNNKEKIGTFKTKENGSTNEIDVLPGKYYVKELKAPKGYKLDKNIHEVEVKNKDTVFTVKDEPLFDPLNIMLKKENENGKPLEGAEFTVKYYNEILTSVKGKKPVRTWKFRTNNKGQVALRDDFKISGDDFFRDQFNTPVGPIGTYEFIETKAPKGYKLDSKPILAYVKENGATNPGTVYNLPSATNNSQKGVFEIKKIDKESGKVLQNVEFSVTDKNTSKVVQTLKTNEKGIAKSNELPLSTYIVKETKQLQGFKMMDNPVEVTITGDNSGKALTSNVTIKNTDEASIDKGIITIKNIEQKMVFDIQKLDFVKGKTPVSKDASLKGAEFDVVLSKNFSMSPKHKEGDVVTKLVTDENGYAKIDSKNPLQLGEYIVKETKQSKGYQINPVSIVVSGKGDNSGKLLTRDVKQTTFNFKSLEEAFNKKIDDLNKLNELNAGKDAKAFNHVTSVMDLGKLNGYKDKNSDGNLIAYTAEMPEYGRISITKHQDGENGNQASTLSGKRIPEEGIKFGIYDSEGKVKIDEFITDKFGRGTSNWLPKGVYIVRQESKKQGFINVSDIKVTINGSFEEQQFNLENYANLKWLKIVKKDKETGKVIPQKGVSFRLFKSDEKGTKGEEIVQTLRYPEDKKIKVFETGLKGEVQLPEKVKSGFYILEEIKAPTGYYLNPNGEPVLFEIKDEKANEPVISLFIQDKLNEPQKGELILEKKGLKLENALKDTKDKDLTNLIMKEGFIEGTTWNLIAKEDIMSYDTVTKLHNKGDVVSTIKTNDKEAVKVKDIALGKYILKEVSVPKQYVLDTREYEIEFTPQQQEVKVHSITQRKYNERKSINFEFTKKFEDTKLFTLNPKAEFGLFVLEDYTENGVTVAKDTMVSKTSVLAKETNDKEFVVKGTFENLPIDAKYYIKELNVDKNYIIDENKHELEEFDFANTKTKENTVTNKAIIENKLQKISLKVSKTEMGSDKSITVEGAKYRLVAVDKVKGENVVGEYITDKNGKIEIVDLPNAGKYYLEEVQSPKGYFKNEEKVNVDPTNTKHGETLEVEVEDEKIPSVETTAVDNETGKKESLPLEEVIIKDKVMYYDLIIGKKYIVDGTLMDKLTNKPVLVNGKEVKASKEFIPTSRNGFVELLFTVPGNVVRGKETVVFEDLYKDGKLLTFHRDIHDKSQTTRTTNPRIKTTLMEVKTGAKEFLPLDKLIHLVDRIEYFDLVPGIKMRFDLVLMNSVTKEVLKDANGKELTASLEFTPETKDGVAEVFITVNAKDLRGISPVAFETLSDISVEGKVRKVAEHKDFNDKGQTVEFKNPSIETTLVYADGNKALDLKAMVEKSTTNLIDKVKLNDLIEGLRYKLVAQLMRKSTGKAFTNLVELEFVYEKGMDVQHMLFEKIMLDSSLAGDSLVAFEDLYVYNKEKDKDGKAGTDSWELIASHKDINDLNQTVDIIKKPENPETGDSGVALFGAMTIMSTLGLIFTFITIKNKKGSLN